MQVLSAQQVREWDHFTMAHEPISSTDLMERAAGQCAAWIKTQDWRQRQFQIFCGKGNNGGDGLVVARHLYLQGYTVKVFILEFGSQGTLDFQVNLQRLHDIQFTEVTFLQSTTPLPLINPGDVVIDALFGTGLTRPPEGFTSDLIQHINTSGAIVVSIDLPSGLFADQSSIGHAVIKATITLTFQCYKLALLMQENAAFTGNTVVLDIGLHPSFPNHLTTPFQLVDATLGKSLYKPRNAFSHKGHFGHALVAGGSFGKLGAIQLAARACLRSGAGLTTVMVPACGYQVMQLAVPEAMVLADDAERYLSKLPDAIDNYDAVGIGPGMGTLAQTAQMVSFVCRRYKGPLVIDADALNCLSQEPELLHQLPSFSVLTPHPREFERLFGTVPNDFERLELAREKAKELNLVIVLKSHHTVVALPGGMCYFNTTGNAGLAKGGSGDVLTGIITGLLAQSYPPHQAAILGVYLHGLAADRAVAALSQESLLATDVILFLSQAFRELGS